MNTTTTKELSRKRGTSLQTTRFFHAPLNKEVKPFNGVNICKKTVTSAAQAMTLIGYGDSYDIPLRSLNYRVKCESYQDWAACIKLIDSYNEFDADLILKAAQWKLNLLHFCNQDNGNNGQSFFDFEIAREGSPAFYITLNSYFHNTIIKDHENVSATETTPAGTMLYWEEYTGEDFKREMEQLASQIKADEFSIEEREYGFGRNGKLYEARFWFD